MARSRSARGPVPTLAGRPQGRHGESLASLLPVLRAVLEQQRHFRREQLAQLDSNCGAHERPAPAVASGGGDRETTLALREVDALVAAGARRALADIEMALSRMRTGRYGYCRSCEGRIPLVVLEAIPKTTLCLTCNGGPNTATINGSGRVPLEDRHAPRP
jgi:DnaK suppressor protein